TRAYLAGLPEWSIAAALVRAGRPIVAALYAPVSDEMFLATAGGGATLNGGPIAASTGDHLAAAKFSAAKRRLDSLAAIEPRIAAVPRIPSLALRLARVPTRALACTLPPPNSRHWDPSGPHLFVHQAGRPHTTLTGERLIYNRPDPVHGALVAAGRARHGRLLDLIRDRLSEFA